MFPGEVLPVPEVGSEIPVQEVHAVFFGCPLRYLPHEIMFLVGADEQRGCKAVEAPLRRLPGRLKQPHLIALDAPAGNVLRHRPDKGPQTVVVALDQGQFNLLGILPQAIAPGPVFRKGMNVGIIPEPRHVEAVFAQYLDGLIGAGSAADMEQGFHKNASKAKYRGLYHGIFPIARTDFSPDALPVQAGNLHRPD